MGSNPQVPRRLHDARVCIVAKLGEEGRHGVGTADDLNVMQPQLNVQSLKGGCGYIAHFPKNPPLLPTCSFPPF